MAKDKDRYEDDEDEEKEPKKKEKPKRKRRPTNFNPEALGDYDVGYGKPPEHSMIKKGEKRNPKGRPKGAKNKPRPDLLADKFLEDSRTLVRDKISRRKLNKRDAMVELVSTSALKGNTRNQHKYLDWVNDAEKQVKADRDRTFDLALAYKQRCLEEIAKRHEEGLDPPVFVPHPDDFHFDFENRTFEVHGPVTPDQATWGRHLVRHIKWSELEHLAVVNDFEEVVNSLGEACPAAVRSILAELRSSLDMIMLGRKAVGCPWTTAPLRYLPNYDLLKWLNAKYKRKH